MTTAIKDSQVKEVKADLIKVELNAPIANGTNVQNLLESYRRAFELAAPQHLDINRVMRVALMTVSRNRSLLECTASSLLGAFMLSVQLGLDIGAREAYLVPFKNSKTGRKEVQLIPDYRGVAKMVRNSGLVTNMQASVVYKADYFEFEKGSNPKLIHRPNMDHDFKHADIIGAYSVANFKDGFISCDVLPRKYLLSIRDRSKAKDGPWFAGDFDFAEMCMKTAIKHHAKSLPTSVEAAAVIALDNRVENARPQNINLFEDPIKGTLLAEMPPDEDEDSGKAEPKKEAGNALDRIVTESKQDADGPQSPASGADTSEQCSVADFEHIEIAAKAAGVSLRAVKEHVTKTMGFSTFGYLTTDRMPEVSRWIEAQKK